MSTNTPSYGEPWHDPSEKDGCTPQIETSDGSLIASGYWNSKSREGVARSIQCVNLLKGHDLSTVEVHSKETMYEVREALHGAITAIHGMRRYVNQGQACADALAKLNPPTP